MVTSQIIARRAVALGLASLILATSAACQENLTDSELEELGQLYKKLELPAVPSDARLVLVIRSFGRDSTPPPPFPAYESHGSLYVGSRVLQKPLWNEKLVKPAEESRATAEQPLSRIGMDPNDDVFAAVAAVAASRGKFEFARTLLSRRTVPIQPFDFASGFGVGVFYQPGDGPPQTTLACMAFGQGAWDLALTDLDRSTILGRLERVMATGLLPDDPVLPMRKQFIERLRASMEPNTAKEGTPEWAVADLVNSHTTGGQFQRDSDERLKRVEQMGFAAVPAAINRLGDMRLTRALYAGGGARGPTNITLDDLVADFLRRISAGEVSRNSERVTKETALVWWNRVKDQPEKDYLVANALFVPTIGDSRALIIELIAKKYPAELPGLYRKAVETSNWSHDPIADQIRSSSMPLQTKVDLLRIGAEAHDLAIAGKAIWTLQILESAEAQGLLRKAVARVPDDLPEKAPPEMAITWLMNAMNNGDDADSWTLLLSKAPAMAPKVKRRVADSVHWKYLKVGATLSTPKLKFLRSFIDDDQPEALVPEGIRPHNVTTQPMGTLGDVVAIKAAWLLGITGKPSAWAPREEWQAFRLKVRQALDDAIAKGGWSGG